MKESLAFTFELLHLYEESLMHYDELEAGFFQTLTGFFKEFERLI